MWQTFAKQHPAKYDSPAVYYTFAFSLPGDANIYKLADRLLRRNLAHTAVSAGSGQVRLGYRFKVMTKDRALAASLATLDRAVEHGIIGLIRWALTNRRAARVILRRRMIRINLRSKAEEAPKQDLRDAIAKLAKIPEELDTAIVNVGKVTGALSLIDDALFIPSYLAGEPFIRLELGSIRVESDQFADAEVLLLLLLHRSGTALLTFAALPGEGRVTDDLLRASSSGEVTFRKTIFDRPAGKIATVRLDAVEHDEWHGDDDDLDLEQWREVTWKEPVPLQEIFAYYARLIADVNGKEAEDGDFLCYTTLFIDRLQCCGSRRRWLARHWRELAGLVMRQQAYSMTKPEIARGELKKDHGLYVDDSRYFQFGNAVIVQWDFSDTWKPSSPVDHANTIAVVENVLLQYWQLRRLDLRLASGTGRLADLAHIQRDLVGGLEEYRSSRLMWVGARTIARQIGDGLELDRTYSRIVERLDVVQQLIGAKSAEVANRRNIMFAAVSALAGLLFAIPGIQEITKLVSQLDTSRFPGKLAIPLEPFAKRGATGVWSLYLLTISTVLAIIFVFAGARLRRHKAAPRRRSFGIPWRTVRFQLVRQEAREGKYVEERVDPTQR